MLGRLHNLGQPADRRGSISVQTWQSPECFRSTFLVQKGALFCRKNLISRRISKRCIRPVFWIWTVPTRTKIFCPDQVDERSKIVLGTRATWTRPTDSWLKTNHFDTEARRWTIHCTFWKQIDFSASYKRNKTWTHIMFWPPMCIHSPIWNNSLSERTHKIPSPTFKMISRLPHLPSKANFNSYSWRKESYAFRSNCAIEHSSAKRFMPCPHWSTFLNPVHTAGKQQNATRKCPDEETFCQNTQSVRGRRSWAHRTSNQKICLASTSHRARLLLKPSRFLSKLLDSKKITSSDLC